MTSAHVEFYKGKICGVFLVIFICGVAAGGAGMKAYLDYAAPVATAAPTPDVDMVPTLMVERMRDELHLDDKQFSEVRSILDEYIMQEADMLSRIESLRSDGRARIEQVLNDQQRETFRAVFLSSAEKK